MLKLRKTAGPGDPIEVEVSGERFVIGREEGADLLLNEDEEVSREHAALRELADGRLALEDLGSRNGTFVNTHRLTAAVSLSGGEEIRIGTTVFAVEAPRAAATKVSGPPPTKIAAPPSPPTPAVPPPRIEQTPPAYVAPAPAEPGNGGGTRVALLVIPAVVLLLIGGAVAFVLISGGSSEALYRIGIGGGWSDSAQDQFRSGCTGGGGGESECNCALDELQKRVSEDEFQQFAVALGSGTTPPNGDEIEGAIEECGGTVPAGVI